MLKVRLGTALEAVGDAAELGVSPVGLLADEIPRQQAALAETTHRPWPLPARAWLMGQTWFSLLFAHLGGPPRDAQAAGPTASGARRARGPSLARCHSACEYGAPPLPWLSRFPELNVRTYVAYGGRPGIYFFSLDAARLAAVAAARRAYRLPYFHAEMSARHEGETVHYESKRLPSSGPSSELRVSYGPTGPRLPLEDGSLERWLAERYCLYVVERGRALRADIHHPPWPLQPAEATIELNTMARPLGLELDSDPLLHYSARQDTLIWALEAA